MELPFLKVTDPESGGEMFIRIDLIRGFEYCWQGNVRVPCVRIRKDIIRTKESPTELFALYKELLIKLNALRPTNPIEMMMSSLTGQGH